MTGRKTMSMSVFTFTYDTYKPEEGECCLKIMTYDFPICVGTKQV